MLNADPLSPLPLNDQIKAGLRGLVAKGLLRPGDRAPSIRTLASSLKVNPNTVARAFRELVLEGLLESRQGDGNYIARAAGKRVKDGLEQAREGLRDALRLARQGGLSWDDVERVARDYKEEEP